MAKKNPIKQKRLGLILMASGVLVFMVVATALFVRTSGVSGFPELLPAQETTAYMEFSFSTISPLLPIPYNIDAWDWKKGKKGAVAFIGQKQLVPYLLLRTSSREQTIESLKNYLNPQGVIQQSKLGELDIFSTPQFSFIFFEDTVVISKNGKDLQSLIAAQSKSGSRLSKDSQFKKSWEKSEEGASGFLRGDAIDSLLDAVSETVPEMPHVVSLDALSFSVQPQNSASARRFQGTALAQPKTEIPLQQEHGYRALLLPLLPKETEFVLAGQNLLGQIKKIDAITASDKQLPPLSAMFQYAAERYVPGIDLEKDLGPLLNGEFAMSASHDDLLFITQISHPADKESIAKLRAALSSVTPTFSPKSVSVTLPDGTQAFEFFPDPSQIRSIEETFRGVEIYGQLWKRESREHGVFDAVVKDKWLVSSSLEQLKHAITLTQEPGTNFRESELYRNFLQPILKNPELLGVAKLPGGKTFGFSKRTGLNRMETGFVFEW